MYGKVNEVLGSEKLSLIICSGAKKEEERADCAVVKFFEGVFLWESEEEEDVSKKTSKQILD